MFFSFCSRRASLTKSSGFFFVRSEFSFVDLDDDSSQICLEILYDLVKKVTHSAVVNLQVFRGISIDKAIDGVTSLLNQF